MRRIPILVAAVLATVVLTGASALAASPKFITASAGVGDNRDLIVNFKLAGLKAAPTVDVTAIVNVSVGCFDQNGDQQGGFGSVPTQVAASGAFSKKGQVTASIAVQHPSPTGNCLPGLRGVVTGVSYRDVVLSTAGAEASLPGPFAREFNP